MIPEEHAKGRLAESTRKYTDVEYEYVEPETESDPFFYAGRYQI